MFNEKSKLTPKLLSDYCCLESTSPSYLIVLITIESKKTLNVELNCQLNQTYSTQHKFIPSRIFYSIYYKTVLPFNSQKE